MEAVYEVPPLTCKNCLKALPWEICNTADLTKCPHCNVLILAVVFPAMFRPAGAGKIGETILTDQEAGCFYHPTKKAVVACSNCGRFLCSLCDIDFGGQHICSLCIAAGQKNRNFKNLDNRRVLYDDLALALAIIPLITVYFTLITAPIALYVAIRGWKAPLSIIPRTKFRFILAIVIALFEIAGWVVLIGIVFFRFGRGSF